MNPKITVVSSCFLHNNPDCFGLSICLSVLEKFEALPQEAHRKIFSANLVFHRQITGLKGIKAI